MAILGVLAVVVLVAINPAEQLARARDSGRISAVAQLGHAVQAYFTAQNAVFPAAATWNTDLVDTGELTTFPGAIDYAAAFTPGACTGNAVSNFCYGLDVANGGLVYTRLESGQHTTKCGATGNGDTYAVFSSADGRGGIVCSVAAEPTPWAAGAGTYQ